MTLPPFLAQVSDAWSVYYGDHRLLSVTIRYLHLTGIVVGGGSALSCDRDVFRSLSRGVAERTETLRRLTASHRAVVPSLLVVVLTGVLMTAADAPTFLESRLFFIKMGLFALLTVNGAALMAAERAAQRGGPTGPWTGLALTSGLSMVLWLGVLLAGTWLTVAA